MIKRTLFFTNPCFLSLKYRQLVIDFPDKTCEKQSIPLEDIGFLILESNGITITNRLLSSCVEENISVIICDVTHHPSGILHSMSPSSTAGEIVKLQVTATESYKNKLWREITIAKITNQANLLQKYGFPEAEQLQALASKVVVGDKDNREAVAAKIYWNTLFANNKDFIRHRYGEYPNNFLNYGYAITRAAVARALSSTGFFPLIGVHHHNKYNSFALVDDIMEPYRVYVDELVLLHNMENKEIELSTENKSYLLQVLIADTNFKTLQSPFITALQRTSASLLNSYKNKDPLLLEYPVFSPERYFY